MGTNAIRFRLKVVLFFLTLLYVMDVKNKGMLFPSEVSVRNSHLRHVVHLTGSLASEIMQPPRGLSSKSIIQGHCDSTCVAAHVDWLLLGAEPSEESCVGSQESYGACKKQENISLKNK